MYNINSTKRTLPLIMNPNTSILRNLLIVLLLSMFVGCVGGENLRRLATVSSTKYNDVALTDSASPARPRPSLRGGAEGGRPSLQRSLGKRDLFADVGPEMDGRTGRPKLLRTVGQRHLQDTDDNNKAEEDSNSNVVDDIKNAQDTLMDTYGEIMTIDETPPAQWSTAQKWGVAIGILVAFLLFSCVMRCLCCGR
mmetsp:Transcript_3389/g.7403  ORF Transcript_3389/g.7403 Transcript_3389/m.7403 type:complete len:195 (-) Transcript_3389:114-698(-)